MSTDVVKDHTNGGLAMVAALQHLVEAAIGNSAQLRPNLPCSELGQLIMLQV